jgi:hypothetical protein
MSAHAEQHKIRMKDITTINFLSPVISDSFQKTLSDADINRLEKIITIDLGSVKELTLPAEPMTWHYLFS